MAELEDIADLPGFGPSKIDSFRNAGYESLEDLRGITWDELGVVKGIKSSTKRRVLLNFLEENNLREKPEKEEKYEKFRTLLEELFQFESADLDFGIYRIMNEKRDQIEEFLEEDLEEKVEAELTEFQATEQGEAQERLEQAEEQIREDLPSWVDKNGNIDEDSIPENAQGIMKQRKDEYLEAKKEAQKSEIGENTEAAIYQDLYRFFKRYYKDGDFIPQRRAANQEKYAIPYNGEEVKLHWANKDQYFVKTGEHFKDYKFRKNSYDIEFKLHDAYVEKTNKKGDDKYFLLRNRDPINQDGRHLTVHFEYRPLTQGDFDEYDLSENSRTKSQDIQKVIEERIQSEVSSQLEDTLNEETESDYSDSTVLQKHMNNYRTKNENDYFIHKDLEGFLKQELDFYLKNEIFSWKEMTNESGEIPTHVRARLNAVENVADEIIGFVTQIEEFQKKLFEKRKFVVNTEYCVTLKKVPEEFYPVILENTEQIQEWKEFYAFEEQGLQKFADDEIDGQVLENHQGMVLDTAHFDSTFKWDLLSSFENISDEQDGLLINGENFQAMRLLEAKFDDSVDCVYIDPPYNTGESDFVFKDNFRHSSWLSMMTDRLNIAFRFMKPAGSFLCHIDEHEFSRLHQLLNENYGSENNLGEIVWNKRNPKGDSKAVATQHEYILSWTKDFEQFKQSNNFVKLKENAEQMLNKASDLYKQFKSGKISLEEANSRYQNWINNQDLSGGEAAYKYIDESGNVYRPVSMAWPNKNEPPEDYKTDLIHPETGKACKKPKRGWRFPSATLQKMKDKGKIIFGEDHTTIPNQKYELKDNVVENFPSILSYGGSADKLFSSLGLTFDDNPKPLEISSKVLEPALKVSDTEHSTENPVVMDFFAGSGTTGDTAIKMNREFNVDIDYILVEMGDHFDSVLLPRIKKKAFSADWKDGRPRDADFEEQLIKYHTIEGYEDTLDNLNSGGAQAGMEEFTSNRLDYYLNFQVDGPSLLDLGGLKDPFNYEMEIRDGDESKEQTIDLIETFNYLLGLNVQTIRRYEKHDREYRVIKGNNDEGDIVVIWRRVENDDDEQFFEDEREFLNSEVLEDENLVYVNYDSALSDTKSIEKTFQNRMWE